ncbi:MAG: lipocalin family protein [Bacteroidetes bacterium]|nr:lipocalin family protein [Bacteroidota bacterium]
MKNHLPALITCLLIISFYLTDCKKSGTQTAQKTKTDLLTQASWKFSAATVSGVDASSYLQPCQKDNIYTFVAAGTGTLDEGTTKCNSGDAQTSPFTWNFASSETVLHISTVLFTGGSNDYTLVSLTENQLVGSQNYPPYGTIVVTFIH